MKREEEGDKDGEREKGDGEAARTREISQENGYLGEKESEMAEDRRQAQTVAYIGEGGGGGETGPWPPLSLIVVGLFVKGWRLDPG